MSSVRQTKTGAWEVDVRSKLLPRRRTFLFETEVFARSWAADVDKLLAAGIVPPQLPLAAKKNHKASALGAGIPAHLSRGHHSASGEEGLWRLVSDRVEVE